MEKYRQKNIWIFLVLIGVISLFADLTHEGAKSIYGQYLFLLGASATTIGFVAGLGEFIGYALRLLTGYISDRTGKYWTMTIIGYSLNLIAIPLLALAMDYGWIFACALILIERMGKAIRHPSKTTLVSFAAREIGSGKGFALQETLDQIGAVAGPLLLFAVLSFKQSGSELAHYAFAFTLLAIPALITLALLFAARQRYPQPQNFSTEAASVSKNIFPKSFYLYLIAISLLALGFADFPLMAYHFIKVQSMPSNYIPIVYALAMAVDALAAIFFGNLFDKRGMPVLIIAVAISAGFAPLVFLFQAPVVLLIGISLWAIGMGAQESILKAVIANMVSKERRGTAYGIFYAGFGLAWFLGSTLMGYLYDINIFALVIFAVFSELLAIVALFYTTRMMKRERLAS